MSGNGVKRLIKFTLDEVPLWKRKVPKYPLYYMGDPAPKVVLPQFWMKMVKPRYKLPEDRAHFIVHPQMSKLDIKQYLQKIYNVEVFDVRTTNRKGKYPAIRPDNREGTIMQRHLPIEKYAFVTLANTTFTYPDWFNEGVKTERMKEEETFVEANLKLSRRNKQLATAGLSDWFGLVKQ